MLDVNPALINNKQTKLFLPGTSPTLDIAEGSLPTSAYNYEHPYAKVAGWFDGSSYITAPNSTDWNISTTDQKTIRFWVRPSAVTGSYQCLLCTTPWSGSPTAGFLVFLTSSGQITFAATTGNGSFFITTTTVTTLSTGWNFVDLEFNNGTVNIYINSVQSTLTGSNTFSTNITSPNNLHIGVSPSSLTQYYTGYLLDIEIANTLRSTSIPTSALTADSYTKLLLHMDGANGSTTFSDSSSSPKTVTRNGNAAQVGLPLYRHPYAKAAAYFDGTSSSYLTTPPSSNFAFGTGDFTVETWVYFPDVSTAYAKYYELFSCDLAPTGTPGGGYMVIMVCYDSNIPANAGKMDILIAGNGGFSTNPTGIAANTWNFVQVVRSSGVVTVYVNGSSIGTVANTSGSITSGTYNSEIGRCNNSTWAITNTVKGYYCDFRVSNVARSPVLPTSPLGSDSYTKLYLPMMDDRETMVCEQTGKKFTVGSGITMGSVSGVKHLALPGTTGNVISVTGDSSLSFTGDCTHEMLITFSAAPNQGVVFSNNKSGDGWLGLWFTTGNILQLGYQDSGGGKQFNSSTAITLGVEYHIALVRYGNTMYFYLNGALVGSGACVTSPNDFSGLVVGGPGTPLAGWYTTSGTIKWFTASSTSRYTSSFVGSTPTFPVVDNNTKLLILPGNEPKHFIDSSSAPKAITNTGNVKVSRKPITNTGGVTVVDAPGGHPYARSAGWFNTSSDFVYTSASTDFDISSGAFTIRGWIYNHTTLSASSLLFARQYASSPYTGYVIYISTTGQLAYRTNNAGSEVLSAANTIVQGKWYFVQISSDGTTVKGYVNGAEVFSTNAAPQDFNTTVYIGYISGGGNPYYYMADFEFAKGVNRTPTVPTSPLIADSYTKLLLPFNMYQDQVAKDVSGTNKALTFGTTTTLRNPLGGKAIYFDSTLNSGISTSFSSDLDIGAASTFTIEGVYNFERLPSSGEQFSIISKRYDGNNVWDVYIQNTAGVYSFGMTWMVSGTWRGAFTKTITSPVVNTDYHFAAVRTGTNDYSVFWEGVGASGTQAVPPESLSCPIYIGNRGGTNYASTGNLRWVHVVKGTALYTADFTPSYGPTIVANTKLLVVPGSDPRSVLDYSPTPKVITRNGNAVQCILPPGKKELYFNGGGNQKLTSASVIDFYQLSEFTIDLFYTHTSTSAAIGLLSQECYVAGKNGNWFLDANTPSTGNITFRSYDGQSNLQDVSGGSLVVGCTYHVAIILKSGVCWLHINGVPVASTSSYKNIGTGGPIIFGHDGINTYLTGKESSARLTKYARWTLGKPFIPPTRL